MRTVTENKLSNQKALKFYVHRTTKFKKEEIFGRTVVKDQRKGSSTYDIRFFGPFLTHLPTHIRFFYLIFESFFTSATLVISDFHEPT